MNYISKSSAFGINVETDSVANGFRRRRFSQFLDLVNETLREKATCSVLDVGGTHEYWGAFGAGLPPGVKVTILNIYANGVVDTDTVSSRVGDACSMPEYADGSFDVVHSNSVIEHVGLWPRMEAMAAEVRRVAPRYFVQTPNYWFPIEPHFRTPFYHMMPEPMRRAMIMRRTLGFWNKVEDVGAAARAVQDAIILDYPQMVHLFPDAIIEREKFAGLTKSLIAIKR